MTNIDMNVEHELTDAELVSELSPDELDAVSGGEGPTCTVSYGKCSDTGGGHIVCTPTVVTCK
jgi:hypothetical protein